MRANLLTIIVNYRSAALTKDALHSLLPSLAALPASHVMVVDNDSGDDSMPSLSAFLAGEPRFAGRVTLYRAPKNGGFAYGNNEGIRQWLKDHEAPDYVLLLNPDTVVREGAIEGLLDFMVCHADVGIAGSRLEDLDGTPQCSAFRFPSIASEFETSLAFGPVSKLLSRWVVPMPISDEARPADWLAGACMILRWRLLDQMGLMDEAYFMYFEEVDFCLQAKRAGWPIWYVPSSHVVHLVGGVSGVTDLKQRRKRRPRYWFESRRRYFLKNHGKAVAALADMGHLTGHLLNRARRLVERKPAEFPERFVRDFIENGTFCRGFDVQKTTPSLFAQILEDYEAHHRDWTKPGFQAVAVHRFGNWSMTIKPKLVRAPLRVLYRSMFRFVRNVYGIELPYSAKLGRRVVVEHQGDIVVHGSAEIGDDCVIRQGVTIGNRHMDRPLEAPVLGAGVNVGAGAKILGKLRVGDKASVGANAVVVHDVDAGDTVIGIPASSIARAK
jgi:N-acetylglucosaminyl-diphospho-decaprenol L-rhamnosyltransferase